ncbi:hypothetical protein M8C21_015861 [Ambrosia artemisiifolia]|uniref:Protein kinase domain-containing protein n=1 Tax=Ambrosia artemisiifolia TaxID=4212 RepID=A0AAD5D6K3_AMBAR|nr:hypothetical protein M8C21_015861 [Ambrosia artemisiifolia]
MDILLTVCQGPLLFYFLLLCCLVNNLQGLTSDGEALVNFRTSIISSDGLLRQWRPEDPDPCGWKGVTCDLKTKRVVYLNLSNHKLSGPLSPDIGKLDRLRFLDLHYNNFYGAIPPELGNCTELQGLFLQNNYLSGFIPSEIGNISKLQTFNVSNNFLAGPIPSNGALDQFGTNSFLGNRGLCGTHINQSCKNDGGSAGSHPTGSQSVKKNSGRLLISASATVGALLLVALMCFWGCFLYKRLGKNEVKGLAMDVGEGASIVMFHGDLPYSSKDIITKLETLTEEHVIGAGGFGTVYKLAMDDGNVFALKRIVKLNEGFDRFFERELEILGSIKHKYLVNLRGYCNSPTSKLLIYDYLSGGSLDEALHGDEESHITTIVAGTFGYLAPEYMQSGRATEKTDIYSFGVLVLEVISGKRPTDASFIEKGLNIVGWLNYLITEDRQREIIDVNCEGVDSKTLDALLSISIQCVSSNPEDRPTMHRVVQTLESEVMTPCPSDFYDSSSD